MSADLLSSLLIQPDGRYLGVVLLFSAWSWGTPPKSTSSPKKSVSCVSAVVVLVMPESLRLVFIGLSHFLLLLYQTYSRWRANFLKPNKINGLAILLKRLAGRICRFVSVLPVFSLKNVGAVTLAARPAVTATGLLGVTRPRNT
ncbi:hypothetical protein [Pseudomonas defluvii]|uniref:hypothetical protein n=1 Tax=Pseudomonas defluvii TaxID=1876757 RepID=UPI0039061E6E